MITSNVTHAQDNRILDRETWMQKLKEMTKLMQQGPRIMVGMSMSPRVYAALLNHHRATPKGQTNLNLSLRPTGSSPFPGVPYIVDERMSSNPNVTVYYDKKIWRKRLKNQRRHDDRKPLPPCSKL